MAKLRAMHQSKMAMSGEVQEHQQRVVTCSSGEGIVGGAGQGFLHIRVHQRLGPHHHLPCTKLSRAAMWLCMCMCRYAQLVHLPALDDASDTVPEHHSFFPRHQANNMAASFCVRLVDTRLNMKRR